MLLRMMRIRMMPTTITAMMLTMAMAMIIINIISPDPSLQLKGEARGKDKLSV